MSNMALIVPVAHRSLAKSAATCFNSSLGRWPLAVQILYRFLVGGAIVSAFSLLGGLFRQRSFAGLFSAAPSVALATLSLTILHQGSHYASIESRSMIAGATAFFVYACAVTLILARYSTKTLPTTSVCLVLWLGTSLGLWFVFLR